MQILSTRFYATLKSALPNYNVLFKLLAGRDWKKNFYTKEASYPKKVRQLERLPENIFNDWLHNFNVHYTQVRPKTIPTIDKIDGNV